MTFLTSIPIEKIRHRPDARLRSDVALEFLAESIKAIGLLQPIRVRRIGDGYEVVAGSHRLQACELLDHTEIACLVTEDDDLSAELAMIDENLMRAELSPAQRATQTARRKAIYEELHPQTRRESTLMRGTELPSCQVGETGATRFTMETAAALGKSERAVQRDAERGERIIPEVMTMIQGTKLDTGSYMDRIKGLTPNDQYSAVKRDLAFANSPQPPGGVASRFARAAHDPDGNALYARFIDFAEKLEALPVAALIAGSGRKRATLGQRASSFAERMGEILEGLAL